MFGAKERLRGYLQVIRPWAMGKDNRGWTRTDFETHRTDASFLDEAGWFAIPEVYQARVEDASHIIFPIVPYDLGFDRFFLSPRVVTSVLNLNQRIASFNATLARLNAATEKGVKWNMTVMLHVGLIGGLGTGGLHESFRITEALVS